MLLKSVHQESLYCPSLVVPQCEEWLSEIHGQTQEPAWRQSKQEKDLLQKQSEGQESPTGRCMEVPDAAGFSKAASRTEMEQAPGAS